MVKYFGMYPITILAKKRLKNRQNFYLFPSDKDPSKKEREQKLFAVGLSWKWFHINAPA